MTRAARLDVGPRTCPRCRRPVLRVYDAEIGLRADLAPDPLPVTRAFGPGDLIFEHHPRLGWHCQSSPLRRGYPLHAMHLCESQKPAKARTS